MDSFDFSQARILFTDVDDTLTTSGRLLPETYQAICNLADKGVAIIPVTGGCAGWCDQIMRTWPVQAVIGEGGALYIARDAQQATRWYYWSNREQHLADQARILAAIKHLDLDFEPILAKDQPFRLVDVAIDYNQDQSLSPMQVQTLCEALMQAGFRVKKSSIHVNVWLGDFDKCAMARRVGHSLLNMDDGELKRHSLFIGDAPNDESMFEFFPNSIGVSNIRPHLEQMTFGPSVITTQRCGLGFTEMADRWLRALRHNTVTSA